MRLHQLSATAFGPFVETVHVDFDDLSAGGVFLLTGDTGAGKTSVLDAVCFALYGEVPGDRHTARHLRSDQAEPGAEPRVVLEVTIGARTFRFTRSPAWDRPKKRGTGTLRVQAHVVVEELRDETWVALTNRLDEAGHLVTSLLGMTCTQFTQVAMLPQNRFQAFLRATSAERQAVLQRLFRTERFEAVERWLVERRLELRRESQARHDDVAAVLNRFQEAAATTAPDEWDARDLGVPADDGSLLAWATDRQEAATTAAAQQPGDAGRGRRVTGRGPAAPGRRPRRGRAARACDRGQAAAAPAGRDGVARGGAHHPARGSSPIAAGPAAGTPGRRSHHRARRGRGVRGRPRWPGWPGGWDWPRTRSTRRSSRWP